MFSGPWAVVVLPLEELVLRKGGWLVTVTVGAVSLSLLPLTISARLEVFLASEVSMGCVGVREGGEVPSASFVGRGGKFPGARSRLCWGRGCVCVCVWQVMYSRCSHCTAFGHEECTVHVEAALPYATKLSVLT